MSFELVIRRTDQSGPLTERRLAIACADVHSDYRVEFIPTGLLRVTRALRPTDPKAFELPVVFRGRGSRIEGSARGPYAAALMWLFGLIARRLQAEVFDPQTEALAPPFEEFEQEARLSIDSYERAVSDDRPGATAATEGNDVLHFLRWMAGLGHLELCGEPRELDDALLGDPGEFYEVLLEHPLVEEVFLTKSEFSQSLRDWRSLQGPEAL